MVIVVTVDILSSTALYLFNSGVVGEIWIALHKNDSTGSLSPSLNQSSASRESETKILSNVFNLSQLI